MPDDDDDYNRIWKLQRIARDLQFESRRLIDMLDDRIGRAGMPFTMRAQIEVIERLCGR